ELERMFGEVLDCAAHRLDAWVTSLATRRLDIDRQDHASSEGGGESLNYLGAYGWVENLKPVARTAKEVPGLGLADVQSNSGGFLHAPSLRHATTGAILRSGRMAERADP